MEKNLAVIGSGPAALMVADRVSQAGYYVDIYEKRPGPGRKLYIAGSSGLNITNQRPLKDFIEQYYCPKSFIAPLIEAFKPEDWLAFIEKLGLKWFLGTSGRYFVEQLHAAELIRKWRQRLTQQGCVWHFNSELTRIFPREDSTPHRWLLEFNNGEVSEAYLAVCLCLGGASYEATQALRWVSMLKQLKLEFKDFYASNVGYGVAWKKDFLLETEGQPIKNCVLYTEKGSCPGDLIITSYGLEGTPIYTVGTTGPAHIDLKPDLELAALFKKCAKPRENLAPLRLMKRVLNLQPATLALLYHHAPPKTLDHIEDALPLLKKFPLVLGQPQPISEAISSGGGLALDELSQDLGVKKYPGLFAAGEMLDWDAPTGGFLIQACVSQGFVAGQGVINYFNSDFSATPQK